MLRGTFCSWRLGQYTTDSLSLWFILASNWTQVSCIKDDFTLYVVYMIWSWNCNFWRAPFVENIFWCFRKREGHEERQRPHFLLRNAFLSSETGNYKLGLEKKCSQKMTMTAPALIHSSDSDNKVTNEISDCPGIAVASVVKKCGPAHRQKHISLKKVVLLYQLLIYVLNFVFRYEMLDWRILANASASK